MAGGFFYAQNYKVLTNKMQNLKFVYYDFTMPCTFDINIIRRATILYKNNQKGAQ